MAVGSASGVAVADGLGVCVGIIAVGEAVGRGTGVFAVGGGEGVAMATGVAVGSGSCLVDVAVGNSGCLVDVAVGSGGWLVGLALDSGGWLVGVAVGSGAGVAVGVEVAGGRGWTPGWLGAHLMGTSKRSTAELRVCGPCMMWSRPPT
jgi:hypothetical protein